MAASQAGKERRAVRTERDIYRAAVELISARGYHGTSLRSVAAAVGMQMSSLYYYFPSKQDLLVEIMTRSMQELITAVEAAVQSSGQGPEQRLRAAISGHILFHAERRDEAFILDNELRALEPSGRKLIIKLRDRYEEIFSDILGEGAERNVLAVPDTKLAVFALLAMCTGVASWYRPGQKFSLEQIAEIYTEMALNGLLAETPREAEGLGSSEPYARSPSLLRSNGIGRGRGRGPRGRK